MEHARRGGAVSDLQRMSRVLPEIDGLQLVQGTQRATNTRTETPLCCGV